jgi:hypothetical protein
MYNNIFSQYLSEAPSSPRFRLEVFKQFCRCDSGQKQSVEILQYILSKITDTTPSPPLPLHTV